MTASIADLKPLLLPPEPGIWPLAWGYWLLIGLVLVALSVWLLCRLRPQWQARNRLRQLQRLPESQQWPALSYWLRQFTLQKAGRKHAGLHGQAWLDWLSQQSLQPQPDSLQQVLSQPYQRHPQPVPEDVWRYCQSLLPIRLTARRACRV